MLLAVVSNLLLVFNSNICMDSAASRDIKLQNLSNLAFDLSRSLKVKSNGAVRLPICDFLLVCNSKYISISYRLTVIAS